MGRYLDEFSRGQVFTSHGRTITETDLVNFAALSGDWNPVHTDETFAQNSAFGARVAHGPMMIGIAFGLLSRLDLIDGTVIALRHVEWFFDAPVYCKDTVRAIATVTDTSIRASHPEQGRLDMSIELRQQNDTVVQHGHCRLIMKTNPVI